MSTQKNILSSALLLCLSTGIANAGVIKIEDYYGSDLSQLSYNTNWCDNLWGYDECLQAGGVPGAPYNGCGKIMTGSCSCPVGYEETGDTTLKDQISVAKSNGFEFDVDRPVIELTKNGDIKKICIKREPIKCSDSEFVFKKDYNEYGIGVHMSGDTFSIAAVAGYRIKAKNKNETVKTANISEINYYCVKNDINAYEIADDNDRSVTEDKTVVLGGITVLPGYSTSDASAETKRASDALTKLTYSYYTGCLHKSATNSDRPCEASEGSGSTDGATITPIIGGQKNDARTCYRCNGCATGFGTENGKDYLQGFIVDSSITNFTEENCRIECASGWTEFGVVDGNQSSLAQRSCPNTIDNYCGSETMYTYQRAVYTQTVNGDTKSLICVKYNGCNTNAGYYGECYSGCWKTFFYPTVSDSQN